MTKTEAFTQWLKKHATIWGILFAFTGVTALSPALRLAIDSRVISNSIFSLIFLVLFTLVIRYAIRIFDWRSFFCGLIVGGAFSAAMIVGGQIYSLDHVKLLSWSTYAYILGLTPLFGALVVIILKKLPDAQRRLTGMKLQQKAERLFTANWKFFLAGWAILFVCWIPTLLGLWPGVYNYDALYQMEQVIHDSVNNHHPFIHTYYLYGCIRLGQLLFGGYNAGMALYSITQMLMLSACFAYVLYFMAKQKAPVFLQIIALIFFALFPVNPLFSMIATKDVPFAGLFVLLVAQTMDLFRNRDVFLHSPKKMILYVLTMFAMCALRNNGFYILLVFIPLMLIVLWRYWKQILIMAVSFGVMWGLYSGPVMHACGVADGDSAKESLSVPIQQMARVYTMAYDQLTPQEVEQIERYIRPEYLVRYNPRTSDNVKDGFRADQFSEDAAGFVQIWVKVGLQHPGIYIDSFLTNTIGYWYPDMVYNDPLAWHKYWVAKQMGRDIEPEIFEEPGEHIEVTDDSKIPAIYQFYNRLGDNAGFQNVPGISVLFSTAMPFWVLILAIANAIYRRRYSQLMPCILLLGLWGTMMLGPVVLVRYVYPITCSLPLLFTMMLQAEQWPGLRDRRRKDP